MMEQIWPKKAQEIKRQKGSWFAFRPGCWNQGFKLIEKNSKKAYLDQTFNNQRYRLQSNE